MGDFVGYGTAAMMHAAHSGHPFYKKDAHHHVKRKPFKRGHQSAHKYEEEMHGDDTVQGFNGTKLKIPPLHKWPKNIVAGTKTHIHDVYSFGVNDQQSISGQQSFIVLSELGTMYQFLGAESGTATPGARIPALAAYHTDPASATATNGFFSAQQISGTTRILLSHAELMLNFANDTNVSSKATILVLEAKQDIQKTPSATTLQTYNYIDAVGVWGQALKTEAQTIAAQAMLPASGTIPTQNKIGYPSINMPNTLPTSSKTFKKYYKVLKAHTMHLGPGAQEDVVIDIPMRKTIDFGKLFEKADSVRLGGNENQYPIALMRGGISVVLIWRGGVGVDATAGLTPHQSNYMPAALYTVVDRKLTYHFLKSKESNFETSLALDELPQETDPGNKNVMAPTQQLQTGVAYAQ